MSDISVLQVAALFRQAKSRYKSKKVVKDSEGKDMVVYEYSDRQVARRHSDKAKRIQSLRDLRSDLIKQVRKDLKSKDRKTQLTALAVALLDHTYERVGNEESAEEGRFGVTGWQAKHVTFRGDHANINYVGKSGVKQSKKVTDPAAVSLLKEITKDKSGADPIFCHGEDEVCVTAKDVNSYLPKGITAKDLRGLHANQEMLKALKKARSKGGKLPEDAQKRKEKLKAEFKHALEESAEAVGHEPSTLRSQYLVPKLEESYLKDGTIIKSLGKAATKSKLEKEDEQTRKMLRKEPKKKPPRYDLRKQRLEDEEEAEEKPNADNDKDLSRNYKKIASLYLAKQVAKSEEAAQKLFEDYKEKNPATKKTWKDFFEKPEDKAKAEDEEKGKGKPKGKKDEPKKPAEKGKSEAEAKAVAHKKLVKDTVKQVKDTLSELPGVSLPPDVRKDIASALEDMTPKQVESFTESISTHSKIVKGMPTDSPGAVKNAERALEDLQGYDFAGALNPAELGQKVIEKAHAESVLKRDKAQQRGKKRLVTDATDELQTKIKELTGDEKYRLPTDVKKTLKEQLGDLDGAQIGGFVESVATNLEELGKQDMESESAVEDARETIADAEEAIQDMDNPDAKAGAVADLIHARRVLKRQEKRTKAQQKAQNAAIRSTAKAFGERKVPSAMKSKLDEALGKMPPDALPDYMDSVQAEARRIRDAIRPDPETGEQEIPPSLITESLGAMRQQSFKGTPAEIGKQVALAMAAQSLIADPFNLAGQEIGSQKLDDAGQLRRGRQAYDKYRELPAEMQVAAAKKITERLKDLDPESSEAGELNKVLDGITLAALTGERTEKGGIPQIPGREVNAGFAEMARAMAKDGQIGLLLGPVEDFYSAEGQQVVHSAMQTMSDEALASSVKSIMPDAETYLLGQKDADTGEYKPTLSEAKKSLLRNTLIDMSIDQMSVMDRVLKSRLEESGDKRFDDPEYRAEKMSVARKSMTPSWWERLIAKWIRPDNQNTPSYSTQPSFGVPGRTASLLSVWSFAKFAEVEGDPNSEMRWEILKEMDQTISRQFGKPAKTHSERALKRFLETKNPQFLRSNPETEPKTPSKTASENLKPPKGKKEGRFSRFSLDTWPIYTAGQPSVSVLPHLLDRRGTKKMSKPLTREAAQTAVKIAELLDQAAQAVQDSHQIVGFPEKIAYDFAYRCDLLSDEIDRSVREAADAAGVSKEAYVQGTGQGTTPGSDDNKNAGPPQPFNPADIGEQDTTPPKTEPDESYMKKNFIQEEFNELRHFQQDGLFSNAKAASEVIARMEAKLAGMRVALEAASDKRPAAE